MRNIKARGRRRAAWKSQAHIILMLVTFLYCFLCVAEPNLISKLIIGVALLFLYYTWSKIWTIFLTAIVVSGAVAMFPFLAPIAFIAMLVLFFMRIDFILTNWRAVLTGFYMYFMYLGVAYTNYFGMINFSNSFIYAVFGGYYTLVDIINECLFYLAVYFRQEFIYKLIHYTSALVIGLAATFIFHLLMCWLYRHGYTTKTALPIMGSTPLLIILLLLPFIKAFDGFDASIDSVDTADTIDSVDSIDTVDVVHSAYTSDVPPPPGYHHTHDYTRMGADGNLQHVRGYIATNPDEYVENNLSYNDAATNTPTAEPAAPSSTETDIYALDTKDKKKNDK